MVLLLTPEGLGLGP